ncbi:hypothetical protein LTR62_007725 [Meristemomyces frigidus]|uniref:Ribonuclease n=1 Tax=Meristemomyces frigidus TaxID=1508187 RepID=A0AAN7TBU0_9PEZI|nr:hypothetical protein LTR62_007725 [Meristemomyces frigidus]
MDQTMEEQTESQNIANETPIKDVFTPPSIHDLPILTGESYTHHSAIPQTLVDDPATECVLGVDEAGRGPVLGPMVYALYYLPTTFHHSLLAETHHFDDSKVLTQVVRSELMQKICTSETDLYQHSGWAIRSLSARDISAAQLQAQGSYNLNAQAMDATIALIQEVLDKGVNIREVYIDTIGPPATYQKKLERIFPSLQITVAKKADSLYPCVSAASVCAKVTRDASLKVLCTSYAAPGSEEPMVWGSGYPSDARCTTWLKGNMHPVFGWGSECRFSWGTAKELLEVKGAPCKGDWAEVDEAEDNMKLTGFFVGAEEEQEDEMTTWFGKRVAVEVF